MEHTANNGRVKGAGIILALLVALLLSSCSQEDVVCGSVEPGNPSPIESRMLEVAKRESTSYCNVEGMSCEFAAYETRGGRTVRVTRVYASDGKCIGALGDERFYSFDESGDLIKVINGI